MRRSAQHRTGASTYRFYVGDVDGSAGPSTLCELPCTDNHDCPKGYFCQGRCMWAEAGLPAGVLLAVAVVTER